MTDTERLDWIEHELGIAGGALVNDDNGHWAIADSGFQNAVSGDAPQDVQTTFVIEAHKWKNSIREAIDAYIAESA